MTQSGSTGPHDGSAASRSGSPRRGPNPATRVPSRFLLRIAILLPGVLMPGLLPALLTGCGGLRRSVDIDSKPSGAVIYVDGERRGLTRSRVELKFPSEQDRVLIQVSKPRYKPVLQYWTVGEIPDNEKKIFVLEVD